MGGDQIRLAVDVGAVSTVAVLAWPDGTWMPVPFDGLPWMPSAAYVSADGAIATGQAAWRAAAIDPAGFEAEPMRRKPGERVTAASGVDVDVTDLVTAILQRVAEQATTVAGAPIGDVRLVVPAEWGPSRTAGLRRAARRAGLGDVTVVVAPVAVAQHMAGTVPGLTVPVGAYVAVGDIGGGAEA